MISDLPNKLTTAVLYHVTLYFMTNLRRTAGAFLIWLLFNFTLVVNMSMWFRLVGFLSRTMEQSTAPTCIMVLLSCIYAGFVVPVPYMVSWLQWFRRVNPIAYTFESLMINEVSQIGHSVISCVQTDSVDSFMVESSLVPRSYPPALFTLISGYKTKFVLFPGL